MIDRCKAVAAQSFSTACTSAGMMATGALLSRAAVGVGSAALGGFAGGAIGGALAAALRPPHAANLELTAPTASEILIPLACGVLGAWALGALGVIAPVGLAVACQMALVGLVGYFAAYVVGALLVGFWAHVRPESGHMLWAGAF